MGNLFFAMSLHAEFLLYCIYVMEYLNYTIYSSMVNLLKPLQLIAFLNNKLCSKME